VAVDSKKSGSIQLVIQSIHWEINKMGENAGESLETAGWEARQKRQAKDEVDL